MRTVSISLYRRNVQRNTYFCRICCVSYLSELHEVLYSSEWDERINCTGFVITYFFHSSVPSSPVISKRHHSSSEFIPTYFSVLSLLYLCFFKPPFLFLRRIHHYISFHFFTFIRRFPGTSSLHIFHPFPFLLFANSLSYSKVFFHPSSSASPPLPIHPHPSRPSLRILYPFSSFRFCSHLCLSGQIIMIFSHPLFLSLALLSKSSFLVLQEVAHILTTVTLKPKSCSLSVLICRRLRQQQAYFPFNSNIA